ncbi:hypothetical protein BC835DRAFT_1442218 [Cytidiella melzeri]|nr:hypothetical protein BC835DRAFT_1442218 [Cytidiella melzeri]
MYNKISTYSVHTMSLELTWTYLLDAVHLKLMSLHDRLDLRHQGSEQLSGILLGSCIQDWQRDDEVDVWIGVGLLFIEAVVHHLDGDGHRWATQLHKMREQLDATGSPRMVQVSTTTEIAKAGVKPAVRVRLRAMARAKVRKGEGKDKKR